MDIGSDHGCFACGLANPVGLGLRFVEDGDAVSAVFTPLPWHEGYEGVVHGGLVATLLDEAMAHALLARGIHGVTARLTVRYIAPLPIGAAAVVRGRIQADRRRLVEAIAQVEAGGKPIASAEGLFSVEYRKE